jgi:hypothetical protein
MSSATGTSKSSKNSSARYPSRGGHRPDHDKIAENEEDYTSMLEREDTSMNSYTGQFDQYIRQVNMNLLS